MQIRLSSSLLRFSNYRRQVEVEAETIWSGILSLVERHPQLRSVLLDGERMRRRYLVFVNGGVIKPDELERPVPSNAEVSIKAAGVWIPL